MTKERSHKWLHRLSVALEKQALNKPINNAMLAKEIDISERNLFRKVKELTGLSPQKYIRKYRLQQSMKLMKSGTFKTVVEISHAIGYTNVSYFILQFEKEFGIKPFEVLRREGLR